MKIIYKLHDLHTTNYEKTTFFSFLITLNKDFKKIFVWMS